MQCKKQVKKYSAYTKKRFLPYYKEKGALYAGRCVEMGII